jgi:hypothetical protein
MPSGIRFPRMPIAQDLGRDPAPIQVQAEAPRYLEHIKALGDIGSALAQNHEIAELKRREMQDTADVATRYMAAVDALDLENEARRGDAARALSASKEHEAYVSKNAPQWERGLSREAALTLRQKLQPRVIEYRHKARAMNDSALTAEVNAAQEAGAARHVDNYSRPDVGTDNSAPTADFSALMELTGHSVAMGRIKADDAAKFLTSTLRAGAEGRARAVVNDDTVAAQDRYLAVYDLEKAEPGATFLRYVRPELRETLRKEAFTRRTAALERADKALEKERQSQSRTFVSRVLESYNTGEPKDRMGPNTVREGIRNFDDIIPTDTQKMLHGLIQQEHLEGGVTDPKVWHSLRIGILTDNQKITVPSIHRYVPERLSAKDAATLIEKLEQHRNDPKDVSTTVPYKQGRTQIGIRLAGVSDVPGMMSALILDSAQAARYADALLTYDTYARQLVRAGKPLDELPQYAAQLADSLLPTRRGRDGAAPKSPAAAPPAAKSRTAPPADRYQP